MTLVIDYVYNNIVDEPQEAKIMIITIYDKTGLIYHHRLDAQRIVKTSDDVLKVYYDWDTDSYKLETFDLRDFGWFEVEGE